MSGPSGFTPPLPPPPPPPPQPQTQPPQRPFYFSITRAPDEILPNCLYLGGLAAALDAGVMSMLGITHILSVCPECTWDVPTHLAIHVDDTPDENILIHLPEACDFIQRAIDSGGKIFVHCMMGISRSVTVVCAYLMKTQSISATDALAYIKSKRPVARPNWGFIEQLDVWHNCGYAPSVVHPVYAAWKRKHDDEHGLLLSNTTEPVRLADKLFIIEDLPSAAQPLATFLRRNNITYLLTLNPHQPISMSESTPVVERCHLNLSDGLSEDLVLHLPEAVNFIDRGLKDIEQRQKQQGDGAVLVHSFDLTRICVTVCAYWMFSRKLDVPTAFRLLDIGLPLYSPTTEFTALMSLYEACGGKPSPDHPEIVAFRLRKKEEEENRKSQGFRQNMGAPWIMWQPPANSFSASGKEKEASKPPGQSILRFS